ncbi:amidohydrolase family protein [Staphylococcus condimenti]|uniref:Amidohydrolase family protein n=1 Tax=Staphylococcus condimenti TaxID=70255 RepID=A0A4Q7CMJ4_9STAP|nr:MULTISPECIES: amidohydrolase family protein [Staphylococcus]APR60382.1 amidohydrolase [Staphylococcus condimenti]MDK8645985.1 amidohydrolase family protein [Staphylococcus condimenti]OFO99079.1 amidohydrolase [Staphylococcus sp. HMSC065E08]RZI00903.1 amidohydrolase family protein [Staphylococcus condimenti]RZI04521.1 amidohydrolase family protein [Staphylococcus condimenti]
MVNILFENATLFDGEKFVSNSQFGVDTKSGKVINTNNNFDEKINLKNKYVIPGLINAHTHIVADHTGKINQLGSPDNTAVKSTYLALKNLNDLLKDGVTYIRDVGSIFDIDIELSKLEKVGELVAPGIIASGSPLTMTGGHFSEGSYEVDGKDEVRKYARKLLKKGVDNIKLMASGGVSFSGETPHDVQLDEEELRAAVVEAHRKGRTACAHAQGTEAIQNAIRAGVDSVEHAVFLDDETVQMFIESDTYIVPTLAAPWAINQNTEILPDFMVEKSLAIEKAHMESIGKAAKAGVKLAMGTDSGTAMNNFDKNSSFELELMVRAGATPLQALQSATVNAAELLKIDDKAGLIEENKLADFIVIEDNPLEDITALQKEKIVYKKGKLV